MLYNDKINLWQSSLLTKFFFSKIKSKFYGNEDLYLSLNSQCFKILFLRDYKVQKFEKF